MRLIIFLIIAVISSSVHAEQTTFHRVPGNLVKNSSFEQNWFNYELAKSRRFMLLQATDMGVGEADGHIDYWNFQNAKPTDSWDIATSRSGTRSVKFISPAKLSHRVRFAGEQSWESGGSHYAEFLPMEQYLADQMPRRQITVSAWCKTENVPAGSEPELTVTVECLARSGESVRASPVKSYKTSASTAFSPGTHNWEYAKVTIPPSKIQGTPHYVTISFSTSHNKGSVWFDDVSCIEEIPSKQPNLTVNPGFENINSDSAPNDWSKLFKWGWFRNTYYAFTGWSHFNRLEQRGKAVIDNVISFSGNNSIKFIVFPGDDYAIQSSQIPLNQKDAHPIEIRAMVKADNIRTIEIMGRDENGNILRQGDFLGDDMEDNPGFYNMGTTGAGTYDWFCVRKYLSPSQPVKSLQVMLCARGFDGNLVPDKNIVGTVWFDDLQVYEHASSESAMASPSDSKKIPDAGKDSTANVDLDAVFEEAMIEDEEENAPVQTKQTELPDSFRVIDVSIGDRLRGKNVFKMVIEITGLKSLKKIESMTLKTELIDPSGKKREWTGRCEILSKPSKENSAGYAVANAPYEIEKYCQQFSEQYKLSAQLVYSNGIHSGGIYSDGNENLPGTEFYFGTPLKALKSGLNGYYFYPEEQCVFMMNLFISKETLSEMSKCEITANSSGKERIIGEIADFSKIFQPQECPPDFIIDTNNMLKFGVSREGFTVHPWDNPVRDSVITAKLYRKTAKGQELFLQSEPVSFGTDSLNFGFISHFPKYEFPETIEKTGVNDKGFMTINGKVYFPVYFTPHFGICPEVNYPPSQFGCGIVDLTEVIYYKQGVFDEELREWLSAKIESARENKRLFSYSLGEGEMTFQKGWTDRLQWLKKAIKWIKEEDSNHIVDGGVIWLLGHNAPMPPFVPDWDVIGVEASFERQPAINSIAKPLMKEKKTCAIVGLETYFYQSNHTLRWRSYRSVFEGANGVGLCPSGMLQSRPDKVNYLRGLNGEFRRLGDVIASDEPAEKVKINTSRVDVMERQYKNKRYVIAIRNYDDSGVLNVKFSFPDKTNYSKINVLFEDRKITLSGNGYEDSFESQKTVHVYELEN